jgi:antitoxin component YwqK of YwqJK toxin-antitoxin module
MTSKMRNIILFYFAFFTYSCNLNKKNLPEVKSIPWVKAYGNKVRCKYQDFPKENAESTFLLEENFKEGGIRYGRIVEGYKEGKWLSGDADFDKSGNVYIKKGIWREEYFKKGLRDSIFRQFDKKGKIIYETTFKMGTGLWKEFHSNGTLYFEANTKDGYFTDTLKLYDDNKKIIGIRLYDKDKLVYEKGIPCFPYYPESVPSD